MMCQEQDVPYASLMERVRSSCTRLKYETDKYQLEEGIRTIEASPLKLDMIQWLNKFMILVPLICLYTALCYSSLDSVSNLLL